MKRIIITVSAIVIILVLIVISLKWAVFFLDAPYFGYAIPYLKEYGIRFGDSPKAVARKDPGVLVEKNTNMTVTPYSYYDYETVVFGKDASVSYEFYNNRWLASIDIKIQEDDKEMLNAVFDEACRTIEEEYKQNKMFQRGEMKQVDEEHYKIDFEIRFSGAISLSFRLEVKNGILYISCS